jgi:F-type H+-transporting ATPase subunit epsilon
VTNGTQLQVLLVTPERKVLEESCDSLSLPASDGYVTILPRHAPLIATLGIGVMTMKSGARTTSFALMEGFFEVSDDRVTVLSNQALAPAEIDAAAARRELDEGKAALGTSTGKAQSNARQMIERAEAKLAVVGSER